MQAAFNRFYPRTLASKPANERRTTRSFSYRGRHDDPGPAKERINARGGATGRAATPPQCGPNPTPWHHFRFSGPPQDPGFGRSGNHPSDRSSARPKRLLGLQAIGGSNPASPTLIGTVPVTACPRRQPRPYLCPHRLEVRMPGSHPGSGVRLSVGVPISFVADEASQSRTGRPGDSGATSDEEPRTLDKVCPAAPAVSHFTPPSSSG